MSITVSIVIVVYNDQRLLRCLQSLKQQTFTSDQLEIIVVENGKESAFSDIANTFGVKYFHCPIKNMAVARNIGVYHSIGRYILFTDADCVADKNWVEEMSRFLMSGEAPAVGGTILRYEPTSFVEKCGRNLADNQSCFQYLQMCPFPYVVLANAGFTKSVIEDVV